MISVVIPDRTRQVLVEIDRLGLLLESDPVLRSVASLVAGAPVRGSWWGHPKGRDIWLVSQELEDHPDLAAVKLVDGKVTWVHRRLWPALLAVARERAPWQASGLGAAGKALLRLVDKAPVRTDALPASRRAAAKELAARLLCRGEQVHTESGAHALVLKSWKSWAREKGLGLVRLTPEQGRRRLEEAAARLARPRVPAPRLPWQGQKS